jgi:hypothetical protein
LEKKEIEKEKNDLSLVLNYTESEENWKNTNYDEFILMCDNRDLYEKGS